MVVPCASAAVPVMLARVVPCVWHLQHRVALARAELWQCAAATPHRQARARFAWRAVHHRAALLVPLVSALAAVQAAPAVVLPYLVALVLAMRHTVSDCCCLLALLAQEVEAFALLVGPQHVPASRWAVAVVFPSVLVVVINQLNLVPP